MNGKKKLVGFLAEDAFSDYAKEILLGLQNAIEAYPDIRLVVIAGRHNRTEDFDNNQYSYKTIYNSVYRLEEMCRLDGLILLAGSTSQFKEQQVAQNFLMNLNNVPKVYIGARVQGGVSVNYDNEPGIREMTDWLVNAYGFTEFCMLGGRDDNEDSKDRKRIFMECLNENGITLAENQYEKTDMSADCENQAARLLVRNPGVQAIFCVNDEVAKGLYREMKKRELVPGKDIMVIGFDNSHAAENMIPPLASIGAEADMLGQKALDVLMGIIAGKKEESVMIRTRLYGRESLPYERYEYTTKEMAGVNREFILRMFDDCFYRYKNVHHTREEVNLRELFYEFIYRMLSAMRRRYMSPEEFAEINGLIDIFFDRDAMQYTDSERFVQSITKLQSGMNFVQKSVAANVLNNRLFVHMKDLAIRALTRQVSAERRQYYAEQKRIHEFLIESTPFQGTGEEAMERMLQNIGKLGLLNAALYLYENPVVYSLKYMNLFPDEFRLMCVMREGNLQVIPKEKRICPVGNLLLREELPARCRSYVAFPVLYSYYVYGVLLCELTEEILDRGEYLAAQIGRAIFVNDSGW